MGPLIPLCATESSDSPLSRQPSRSNKCTCEQALVGLESKIQFIIMLFRGYFLLNLQGNWRFEGESRGTIPELIAVQHDSNQPVTNKSQAILKTAIVKETWELNNDDIETCEKIGNVRKRVQTFF